MSTLLFQPVARHFLNALNCGMTGLQIEEHVGQGRGESKGEQMDNANRYSLTPLLGFCYLPISVFPSVERQGKTPVLLH